MVTKLQEGSKLKVPLKFLYKNVKKKMSQQQAKIMLTIYTCSCAWRLHREFQKLNIQPRARKKIKQSKNKNQTGILVFFLDWQPLIQSQSTSLVRTLSLERERVGTAQQTGETSTRGRRASRQRGQQIVLCKSCSTVVRLLAFGTWY